MHRTWNWRAIRLHATILILVPSFLVLARWQLSRALKGNGLSWAYSVEWPLFAFYAIYVWWHLAREERGIEPRRGAHRHVPDAAKDAAQEQELAEYNAYLDALRQQDAAREKSTG